MKRKILKFFTAGGFLFLNLLALSIYPQLKLPTLGGPHAVGRAVFHWVDTWRPEILTKASDDFREVTAMVWYPAEPGTGAESSYFPSLSNVAKALIQSGELGWWEVFGLRFIRSNISLDSAPAKKGAPYPVVLFSPGNGTNIEFYSGLAGEIASHGYIVIGLNHPYDVAAVELSNGKVAPYDKDQWLLSQREHEAYTAERIKVRTEDMLFALDQLTALNASMTSPLAGMFDLDSVAAAGHSLGGITASEACKADPRLKACLNFDGLQKGGPFSMDESALPPSQPFLFLTKESELHPKLIESFESTSESYWVVIHGASHDSFTDGPLLQPSLLPVPNQADQYMNLIQKYTLAFLDHTLKLQPNGLLSVAIEGEDVSVKVFPSQ